MQLIRKLLIYLKFSVTFDNTIKKCSIIKLVQCPQIEYIYLLILTSCKFRTQNESLYDIKSLISRNILMIKELMKNDGKICIKL